MEHQLCSLGSSNSRFDRFSDHFQSISSFPYFCSSIYKYPYKNCSLQSVGDPEKAVDAYVTFHEETKHNAPEMIF